MELPFGQILNLKGIEKITGFGDDMNIRNMSGNIEIDAKLGRKDDCVRATGDTTSERAKAPLLVEVGKGESQVYIQPLRFDGALLIGRPSQFEEMGVVLDNKRLFFETALSRGENGIWSPIKGAPAVNQWFAVDKAGVPQAPAVTQRIFDLLFRAAELYYRANYRDFVLAELAWLNNFILDYTEGAEKVRLDTATEEERAGFYRIRFSGAAGAVREAEVKILNWLDVNPETRITRD